MIGVVLLSLWLPKPKETATKATMMTIRPNASLTRTLIRHRGSGTRITLPTPFATAGGGGGNRVVRGGSNDGGGGGGNAVGGAINGGGASLLH